MAGTMTAQGGSDARRHDAQTTGWFAGVVLIVLGIAFILENAHYVTLTQNWWAVFLYLAAVASFANTWRSYRATGKFGATATGSLVWGMVFTVVASIFIFNLLWDTWWPAILIAVGSGILIGAALGRRTQDREPDNVG